MGVKTVTGSNININDAAAGTPISLTIEVPLAQNGSGNPTFDSIRNFREVSNPILTLNGINYTIPVSLFDGYVDLIAKEVIQRGAVVTFDGNSTWTRYVPSATSGAAFSIVVDDLVSYPDGGIDY